MQFKIGDETDTNLCKALKHEFLRCNDAYFDFADASNELKRQPNDKFLSYHAYNAYSRFLLHLYEFYLGALRRDLRDLNFPNKKKNEPDRHVQGQACRVFSNAQEDKFLNWIDSASLENVVLPTTVPADFAKEWRVYRNKIIGHVTPTRSFMSLSEFYQNYHFFLELMFRESRAWWGRMGSEFPDLGEMTSFTVLLQTERPQIV